MMSELEGVFLTSKEEVEIRSTFSPEVLAVTRSLYLIKACALMKVESVVEFTRSRLLAKQDVKMKKK